MGDAMGSNSNKVMRLALIVGALMTALTACSGNETAADTTSDPGDVSTVDVIKKDTKDTQVTDTELTDGTLDVQPGDDATATVDAGGDTFASGLCPGGLAGGFNCPCDNAGDCDSGICVASDLGKVCSKACDTGCPTDWKCVQKQSAGGDLAFVCAPAYPNICKPCATNADCQANGSTSDFCAPLPGGSPGFINGSFCLAACQEGKDDKGNKIDVCKAGYTCMSINLTANSAPVKQCVPDSFNCPCQDAWAQAGLSTECSKSSQNGICKSKRECAWVGGKAVLTECSASVPTAEICGNNIDDDCNGKTDEDGAQGCTAWYPDNDQDGFGTGIGACTCTNPGVGYSSSGGDCNDLNASIHPGPANQLEVCDNVDNNCNGETDESGAKGCKFYYADLDGDGFGDENNAKCLCPSNADSNWIQQAGDCDDTPGKGAKIKPGVNEKCDGHFEAAVQPDGSTIQKWVGVDDNCDGKTDDQGAEGCKLYYVDQDKDSFGVTKQGLCLCYPTVINNATAPGDCDDNNGGINPQAFEICDAIDNDCSGVTDDGTADSNCGAVAGGSSKCVDGQCGVGTCTKGFYDVNADPSDGCECQALGQTNGLGLACGVPNPLGDLPDGGASIQKGGQILPGEQGDWYSFKATDLPDTQPGSCDNYNVHISFVLNPNNIFVFDVYRGSCAVSDQICSAETVHDWSTSYYGPPAFGPGNLGTDDIKGTLNPSPSPEASGECQCVPAGNKNWAACVKDPTPGLNTVTNCGPNGLPGMNICKDNTATYYVRVFTKPGAQLTCDQYIIKFDNAPNGNVPPPQN